MLTNVQNEGKVWHNTHAVRRANSTAQNQPMGGQSGNDLPTGAAIPAAGYTQLNVNHANSINPTWGKKGVSSRAAKSKLNSASYNFIIMLSKRNEQSD